MELKKLMEHISIIPDYRQAWKMEHKLSDILLLTICAVISGAEGWEDIEDFGETHPDFLKQYGDFENGIPVHDTIARVGNLVEYSECPGHHRRGARGNEPTTGRGRGAVLIRSHTQSRPRGERCHGRRPTYVDSGRRC